VRKFGLVLAALGLSACPIYGSLGYWEQVGAGSTGGPSGSGGATSTTVNSTSTTTGGAGGAGTGGTDGGATCMPVGSGSTVWSHGYGEPGDQSALAAAYAVAVDAGGNVVVAGNFLGSVDFGCGKLTSGAAMSSGFVAKLDPGGVCLWSENLIGSIGVASVAVDASGNVLVTGTFEGSIKLGGSTLTAGAGLEDLFVAKLDPSGTPVWGASALVTGGDSHGTGIAVDTTGNVIVIGYFSGSIAFAGTTLTSAGGGSAFVAKLDLSGTPMWGKSFGTMGSTDGDGIAVDASGSIVITGTFGPSIDFGCGTLTTAQEYNPFVAKLSPTGACSWSRAFTGATAVGTSIAVDPSANVVVTGYLAADGPIDLGGPKPVAPPGGAGMFVAKFAPNGTYGWGNVFGTSGATDGDGVAVDGEGGVFVVGYLNGSVNFGGSTLTSVDGENLVLASFEADGSYRWAKRFGTPLEEYVVGIAVDPSSHVLIAGAFANSVDFGCGPFVSAGEDAFVAEFVR